MSNGRSALGRIIIAVRAAEIAGGITVAALAFTEVDIFYNDFGIAALVALFVDPVTKLETTGNDSHAALLEILADKLSSGTPCNTVDKIGLLFTTVTAGEIAVNSEGEGCNRRLGLGIPELRITRQATHDGNVVKHQENLILLSG